MIKRHKFSPTEIEYNYRSYAPLDPYLFSTTYGSQSVRYVDMIGELIDNAIDAEANEVRIISSSERCVIIDNGEGIPYNILSTVFLPGCTTKNNTNKPTIGKFGVGILSATHYAKRVEITTVFNGNKYFLILDCDYMQSRNEAGVRWKALGPVRNDERGTVISMSKLRNKGTIAEESSIRDHVVSMYSRLGSTFTCYVNSQLILFKDEWKDKNIVSLKKEKDYLIQNPSNKRERLFVDYELVQDTGSKKGGIAKQRAYLYRGGRLIAETPFSKWSGQDPHNEGNGLRLIIDLKCSDDFLSGVSYNKNHINPPSWMIDEIQSKIIKEVIDYRKNNQNASAKIVRRPVVLTLDGSPETIEYADVNELAVDNDVLIAPLQFKDQETLIRSMLATAARTKTGHKVIDEAVDLTVRYGSVSEEEE